MQALILAGGEGTRLRPLTSTIPKPVVPLANRPHIEFMLEWLHHHGVDEAILSCGFLADDVRRVLGEGEVAGVTVTYVEEPTPLGTGGALRYAGDLLHERFVMVNGDVLTDLDLTAQLAQHERTGALATISLVGVDDPSMYGLVRLAADHVVEEFVEKPSSGEIDSNLINAGAYVLERAVLDQMPPAGQNVSIEREVFPRLVGKGLYGFVAQDYWLDIGTPERYLQGTFDVLEGNVRTDLGDRLEAVGRVSADGTSVAGRLIAPVLVGTGSEIGSGATVGGRVALGPGVSVGEGARIESSVVLEATHIGPGTHVASSVIGPRVTIGERCHIEGGVVLGEGVTLGAGNVLKAGARISPGVTLPDGPFPA